METTHSHREPTPAAPLSRPLDDRMVAGVAAGLARYFDVDAAVVRLVFVVLVLVGGAGLPLYAAGWLLMPEDGARRPLAADLTDRISGRPAA